VNEDEFRGLQERVQLINDLAEHPGWEVALDRARHQLYFRQKQLIMGKAKSYEEYVQICAWMDGLSFFMQLPEMVQKELQDELERRSE
jgi:hypothetical protein